MAPSNPSWAMSGGMWLTGRADGPPQPVDAPIADHMVVWAAILRESTGVSIDGPALLGERAAIAKLHRNGSTSAGGAASLHRCSDGWIALNLPRREDVEMVPALVGARIDVADWTEVQSVLRERGAAELVRDGAALGMAVARVGERAEPASTWCATHPGGAIRSSDGPRLVLDCSALWAGPLCGDLLAGSGDRVLKIEHPRRCDGARYGPAEFFDLLNARKESVTLDFTDPVDRSLFEALLDAAVVVIEGTRPRVFEEFGFDRDRHVDEGAVWLTVSAHGLERVERNRVGFGDDAAVAGGLVCRDEEGPMFVGDAIADPIAGLAGAVAVTSAYASGRGALIDLSLARAAAYCRNPIENVNARLSRAVRPPDSPRVGTLQEVLRPRARTPSGRAVRLGADTERIRAEFS